MGIMSAEQEQANRNAEEKLFGRGVLVAIINLFPHVQVVVGAGVEFKRHTAYVMKHDIGAEHVDYVGKRP